MPRIDRETTQRILDAADIVDVVSDFVSLKRRGANYIGLCPFHNERTPSFSVSKSKGICKCFSCGKGGSAVNFIMEIEQISFYEALKYLAKKYNIEIKERELTDSEKQAENDREAMLALNNMAMEHFRHNLLDTADGRDIGLTYFRERGINDAMIKRFSLGYALENRNDFSSVALSKGYEEKYLIDTGLCARTEQGRLYDRFRGRVIYPVFSISGKVVAFGGRTLRSDKNIAKYVNSPESLIYSKRSELYGLYQAKQAINRKDKCILVEGYMDVISMHQSGIENVVASSGTSLTEQQIHVIHRFTDNITVIYDSDPAGIKASLRGIDMLLAEGMNVKVLLLPDGDDPDSFAQHHSSTEVEEYIAANETDFIKFKTSILLKDAENDPIARSRVITDIVRSISVIPSDIQRAVYIQECSRLLSIDETVLTKQVARFRNEKLEKDRLQRQKDEQHRQLDLDPETSLSISPQTKISQPENIDRAAILRRYELEMLRYALKYGQSPLCEVFDEDSDRTQSMTVIQYIRHNLTEENISFINPDISHTFEVAESLTENWDTFLATARRNAEDEIADKRRRLREELADTATGNIDQLQRAEKLIEDELSLKHKEIIDDFAMSFISKQLISHPDDIVRNLTTELVSEKYTLSKVHTKFARVETERDRLPEFVQRAWLEYISATIECDLREVRAKIAKLSADKNSDINELKQLLEINVKLNNDKAEFAKYIGERVITGSNRRR